MQRSGALKARGLTAKARTDLRFSGLDAHLIGHCPQDRVPIFALCPLSMEFTRSEKESTLH
jgi:hypothetical protein